MAKKNDQLADSLDTENTGGLLSGFLAEEEHLDRRAMLRLGTWGAASVGAVIVAVLANQSQIGLRREQFAAADLTRQSQQIQSVAKESQNETRRLASAIDTLNGDRDRLYSRITVLEQGLDSVTGSIAREKATAAAPPAPVASASSPASTPVAAPALAPAPASAPPVAQNSAPAPAPAQIVATATQTAVTPPAPPAEKPQAEAKLPEKPSEKAQVKSQEKPQEKAQEKVAEKSPDKKPDPAPAAIASVAPESSAPPITPPSAPLMASKSMIGPPDPAAQKLIEPMPSAKAEAAVPAPVVVASAPPTDKAVPNADQASQPQLAVQRTAFGVDVGGANSVPGLRALWMGLLKSRSNAPLKALEPIIVVKEGNNGLGMQLRLVAGPLTDAAAAAKICAIMAENQRPCTTTVFDGQRLAMKNDDTPTRAGDTRAGDADEKSAATKPVSGRSSWHRRSAPKHVAAEEPPPPPKPEPSTLSSFFSRH